MTIKLYALTGVDKARHFSPHVWKVELALAHKGLAYAHEPVSFTDVPHIEGGAKIVPVIRDGDNIVADSFKIAEYLDAHYPQEAALLGDQRGIAHARVIESWSAATIHPFVAKWAVVDIHDCLDDENKSYFRKSRETRFGKSLEDFIADRDAHIEPFLKSLTSLRITLSKQPFLGGETPSFADYIVFGPLQWLRIISGTGMIPTDDPVIMWFERCLDLYDGLGRNVKAA